jgi:hypothetical protein
VKVTKTQQTGAVALMSGSVTAGGVIVDDTGGYFPPGLTLEEILALIGEGSAPGSFLRTTLGGVGVVQALGTLGATELIDLANANYFWGTLDQDCTITTVGWTNLKDCQITVELIQDGSGGSTPTFTGVTWIGGTPTWDTTAGTVTHVVLLSRDGGTTIYGAVVGSGGTGNFLEVINGGGGTVQAHGNLGSTETINTASGNYHWGTLNADCTFTFTTIADTAERWFTLELIEDGTGGWDPTWPGSVAWLGGSTPTHDTTAGTTSIYAFFTRDGGTTWIGGQLGGGSGGTPATTVTDETTFGIAPAVGTDTEYARQDHTHGTPPASHTEVLMASGPTFPPEPLETGDGTDWIWVEVFP